MYKWQLFSASAAFSLHFMLWNSGFWIWMCQSNLSSQLTFSSHTCFMTHAWCLFTCCWCMLSLFDVWFVLLIVFLWLCLSLCLLLVLRDAVTLNILNISVRLDSDWHPRPQSAIKPTECVLVYFRFTECTFSISEGKKACLWHFQRGQLFCYRLTASNYSQTVTNLLSNMYTQIMFLTFPSFHTFWQSEPHTVNIQFNLDSFVSVFTN